jgi:hypothetical protein
MTDSAGAPLHSLGHRQDSSVIIACNAAPAPCSVAAMVAYRSPVAVSTSMASFSSRRSRWARSRRRAIQPCAAGHRLAASSAGESILKANS